MREFLKLFERRYSAVSTSDINNQLTNINNNNNSNNNNNNNNSDNNNYQLYNNETTQKIRRKSLHSSRTLSRGFSIVDSFFNQRQNGKGARWPKCVFLLLAFGIFCLSTFSFLYIVQPYINIFKWKLVLSEDGEIFDLWARPPVNLYIKIYLFNITNSDEFLAGNEKMRVQEIGPYVYREMLTHENITFNPNGTLSTEPSHPLVWQEHLSEGHKEDDSFVLPNIALLSIAQLASERNYFFRLPINILIRNTDSQPLVKMTAREFMFGFESPLTTVGNTLLPNWIHFDKVGLIDRMYDFDGDFETFYTGETDIQSSGLYDTFRGSKNLPQWETDHCSKINGASDGTKFKSFIEGNETLLFFRKSMCRPQRMVPVDEPPTRISGLVAQKYMFEENALDNGRFDEKNKCFCHEDKCLPYGLIDVTSCYYGFPIALSYPHFLDADPKFVTDIDGSTPNRTEHESYFMIQPMSGLPLKLSVKFQINLAMNDVSNMAHVESFSHITIPMLWFEIAMNELPVPLQNRFNLYLNILPVVEDVALWGTLAIGIILLLSAITKTANKLCSTQQRKMSIQNRYHSMQLKTSVYMPCEEKISDDTKCIRINDYMTTIELIDENKGIIEQEPVLSGSDIEGDGNESQYDNDTGHGSSTDDRDSNDDDDNSSNTSKIKDNTSTTSSGVSSKQATPCLLWDIEQRSSIDDMSNEIFIELRINEDDRISIGSEDSISCVLDKI